MFVTPLFPRSVYALKCSMYSVYWRAHVVLNSKDDWSYLCLPWFLSIKTDRWMHRHMIFPVSAYWDNGTVAALQLANAPVWIRNNRWADWSAVSWHSYRHRGDFELTTVPCVLFVDVEPYRLTVQKHHCHCWLCGYFHNYNQLRLTSR